LAALWIFKNRSVDVVLLEVGLGGRLDAANIIDPTLAIITSIDLDHQEWLGDTRDLIAIEKAGILRPGIDVVVAEPQPPAALVDAVTAQGAKGYWIGRDFQVSDVSGSTLLQLFNPRGENTVVTLRSGSSLLGQNVAAALQALLLMGIEVDQSQLVDVLQSVQLSGRRELVQWRGLEYLLDVAHNPAAIDKLVEYIDINPCKKRTIALFSAMEDKSIHDMIRACNGRIDAWFLADQPHNPRAAKAADIASILRNQGCGMVSISKNLRQGFRRAQSLMVPGDRLIIFGSFFTVAAVMPLLEKDRNRGGV